MTSARPRARLYSGGALLTIILGSLLFAVLLGKSPAMKLALFLLGLAICHGALTVAREFVASRGSHES